MKDKLNKILINLGLKQKPNYATTSGEMGLVFLLMFIVYAGIHLLAVLIFGIITLPYWIYQYRREKKELDEYNKSVSLIK